MQAKFQHNVLFPLILLILSAIAVAIFIGLPIGDSANFSESELQQVDEIAADLGKFMGDVTISPNSCDEVLSKLSYYIDRISPLTDKLVSLDADSVDQLDFNKISDLSIGVQWIYSKCQK